MLAKTPYLDASRVGIWGWSGGGVATLNAMFRYPDLYKMGMAVAPAPDNRYYDTIYTERYLGLPKDDPEVYKHGCADHIRRQPERRSPDRSRHGRRQCPLPADRELLINALVAANKPFTMMAYPNRTHSISEGEGTTLHLYSLLTRYLNEHLPANGTH